MDAIDAVDDYFNASLDAIQKRAKERGFDLWKKEDEEKADTSLTGAVKGITQEQASMLGGQMNTMRISQSEGNEIMRQQLFHLFNIDRNTEAIEANTRYIKSIHDKMDTADPLRASGLT